MASILTPITDPDKLMEEEVYADISFANANHVLLHFSYWFCYITHIYSIFDRA